MANKIDVSEFIGELGAGLFEEKLAHALREVALGAVSSQSAQKGVVNIQLQFKRVGDNSQLLITHKLAFSSPTRRGKKGEEDTTQTSVHVGPGGVMSVSPPKEDSNGQLNIVGLDLK